MDETHQLEKNKNAYDLGLIDTPEKKRRVELALDNQVRNELL